MLDLETSKLEELKLVNLAMSLDQVKAVSSSMAFMPKLHSLHLENTNLTDLAFSVLLRSINLDIPSFKQITLRGSANVFGKCSHEELQKILMRRAPF